MTTRPGVGKVMIALTCDSITSGWSYGDSVTMLKEGMIKLHYINPNKLSLKYSTKKLKTKIYGFDKYSVLTLKNLNSPEGDTSYRNLLKIPKVSILSFTLHISFENIFKDYISTLASESGGSVFTQDSMVSTYRENKHAASIFGRIVAKSAKPNSCQVDVVDC